mmetsp:Transcript_51081/g.137090  ORF Transcript_51081/g.137090 Transcript_51081/m.137090 type:complete len:209 (+) Transcript_51081:363-989(+)
MVGIIQERRTAQQAVVGFLHQSPARLPHQSLALLLPVLGPGQHRVNLGAQPRLQQLLNRTLRGETLGAEALGGRTLHFGGEALGRLKVRQARRRRRRFRPWPVPGVHLGVKGDDLGRLGIEVVAVPRSEVILSVQFKRRFRVHAAHVEMGPGRERPLRGCNLHGHQSSQHLPWGCSGHRRPSLPHLGTPGQLRARRGPRRQHHEGSAK